MKFPEVTEVDMVCGMYPKKFFQECLLRNSKPKYEKLAQTLFFNGGSIPLNKSLPKEHLTKGIRVLRSIINTFGCKHEHKVHVCGVILAELCEEKESKSLK